MIILSTFNFGSLIPIAILLLISVIIPVILSIFGLKFIPVLVVEIICGVIIGNIPFIYEQFVAEGTLHFSNLIEGIYTIGMAVLLFLQISNSLYFSIIAVYGSLSGEGVFVFV